MAGVPSGRACEACRKQRKKCDEKQPACGRCKRLKLNCVGSGARRFLFKSENEHAANKQQRALSPAPRRVPSSDISKLANELVHIMKSEDMRYGLFTYGIMFEDLPRRLGRSPILDASLAALCTSFHTLHNKRSGRTEALNRHVHALAVLRNSLEDQMKVSVPDIVCAIYITTICQEWIGNKDAPRPRHGKILAHLLHANQAQYDHFGFEIMQAFYGVVVEEAFTNPTAEIDPVFWKVLDHIEGMHPVINPMFTSISARTIAEVAWFIRTPVENLDRIRYTYDLTLHEATPVRQVFLSGKAAAQEKGASFALKKDALRWQTKYSVLVGISCILNRVLRAFDPDPTLLLEARDICDEGIWLARDTLDLRPLASSHMPIVLVPCLASTTESYRAAELEDLLMDYQADFYGADYMAAARTAREGFENIDEVSRNMRKPPRDDIYGGTPESDMDMLEASSGCIIL